MALDIVIGRHGDSLQGRVLNKAFNITTEFGSLAVPTRQIRRIYFRAPGAPPHDEIYLKNSDKLVGAIGDQSVQLHGVGGTDVGIPVTAVLAVLIEWMEQPSTPALLEAAKPLRTTQKARRR